MLIEQVTDEIMEDIPFVVRIIRNEMRRIAQPELSVAQFRIMSRLSKGMHTNKRLAEWMGISSPAMSKTVDILVKKGFVSRAPQKDDRREVDLSLTFKGSRKYMQIRNRSKKMISARLAVVPRSSLARLSEGISVLREVFVK